MDRDIRGTANYHEAFARSVALRQPGTGQISDATDVHAFPEGEHALFVGAIVDRLEGSPTTRICQVDLRSGETRVLTFGPNTDRLPKCSSDATQVAFLSDRHQAGDFQLYLLDLKSGAAHPTPPVEGWVEYFHWSPDGKQVLLAVAGHGADVSGAQGAVTTNVRAADVPSWMPLVSGETDEHCWRSLWVYNCATQRVRQVTQPGINIWEAAWCGNQAVVAVASAGPEEGLWYRATLHMLGIGSGGSREMYKPQDQLGWPAASPSGKWLVIVEAICSDRWLVAGDLLLIDSDSGQARPLATAGVDVTYTEWRSEDQVLIAGHRGFETVVGLCDVRSGTFKEVWSSRELTGGGRYVAVSGLNALGDCVLVGEGFVRAPEIATIRKGRYLAVRSFDLGYAAQAAAIESVASAEWKAPDGVEIQGWLLRPKGAGPFPLIMAIHGGPVWHWRPTHLGRPRSLPLLILINRGYAVFLPNPRGSAGRGRAFAAKVRGDMNGADTLDLLSGLDYLVTRDIVDVRRIGVIGTSYGGNMTAWLITQDARFAAAVAVAPHTNQVTEHLLSNIPDFVSIFLADHYTNAGGKYYERSPIMHAHKARTPTLNICGALDRCTPPAEALQFHNALREGGVESVLVTYPEEGHGVQKWPAAIDYAARVVSWFERHMPS